MKLSSKSVYSFCFSPISVLNESKWPIDTTDRTLILDSIHERIYRLPVRVDCVVGLIFKLPHCCLL